MTRDLGRDHADVAAALARLLDALGLDRVLLVGHSLGGNAAALYAGIPVVTAAPPYPARLVGIVPLSEEVSVGAYQRQAHAEIDGILANEHHYVLLWAPPYRRLAYWNKFGMPEGYLTRQGDSSDLPSLWWVDPQQQQALTEHLKELLLTTKQLERPFIGMRQQRAMEYLAIR